MLRCPTLQITARFFSPFILITSTSQHKLTLQQPYVKKYQTLF